MGNTLTSVYLTTKTSSADLLSNQSTVFKTNDSSFNNYFNKSFKNENNNNNTYTNDNQSSYKKRDNTQNRKDVNKPSIDKKENIKEKNIEKDELDENTNKEKVEGEIVNLLASLLNMDIQQIEQFISNNELTIDNIKEFIMTEFNLQNVNELLSVEGLGETLKEISALLGTINFESDTEESFQNVLSEVENSNKTVQKSTQVETIETNIEEEQLTEDIIPVLLETDETVEVKEEQTVVDDESVQSASSEFQNNNDFLNFSNSDSNDNIFSVPVQDVEVKDIASFSKIANAKITNFNSQNVLKQIVDNVKVNFDPAFTEIKVQLSPENLGDVTLKVVTENGIITAQFIAENEKVKEVIESNFTHLSDTLKEKGINISELSVSVGQDDSNNDSLQHFNKERSKSSSRISQIISDINEEELEELDHYVEDDELIQSTISYTV